VIQTLDLSCMSIRRTSNRSSQDTGFYNPEFFADVGSRIAYSISPDPDAEAYVLAVQAADGEALEPSVVNAITDFVVGCKSDGIWDAIKASCILAGARTLAGALVPLVGTAPTSYNFVSGDYNRATGLVGDGSTKYLNSNRANNADPQNSRHLAVYATTGASSNSVEVLIGSDTTGVNGVSLIYNNADNNLFMNSSQNALPTPSGSILGLGETNGFIGNSRSSSASFIGRCADFNTTFISTSEATDSGQIVVFARTALNPARFSTATIAFYSVGSGIDLELFDNRVSRLINNIAFYINTGLDGNSYNVDTLRYINVGYARGGTLS